MIDLDFSFLFLFGGWVAETIAGGSALLGGLLGYYGQREANAANLDIARETNAFNAAQAINNRNFLWAAQKEAQQYNSWESEKQMQFQRMMSNSAHQRAVQDMKMAGLNPMLAVMKGGASTPMGSSGHSSPTGGAQASGVAARMENSASHLGDALGRVVPSALSAANLAKDIESKDAGIAATKAQALAQVAQANNANASAKATEASMGSIVSKSRAAPSEAEASISEAATRKARAEAEKGFAKYDSIEKRVLNAIGGATDALNIRRLLLGNDRMKQEGVIREEEHLRRQGKKGMRVP